MPLLPMPPSRRHAQERQTVLSVSDEALKTGDKNVGAGSLHVDDGELWPRSTSSTSRGAAS